MNIKKRQGRILMSDNIKHQTRNENNHHHHILIRTLNKHKKQNKKQKIQAKRFFSVDIKKNKQNPEEFFFVPRIE